MSINSITLTGRICKELELKTTQSDKSVCSFNIAVDDGWGENKKTLFMTIVSWNSQADYISKYGHKGDMIAVNGRLTQREYANKDGVEVKINEVVASSIQLMSQSKGNNDLNNNNKSIDKVENTPPLSQNKFTEIDMFDDDLPF